MNQSACSPATSIDAERRVNVLRVMAIAAFYLIHLWHVSMSSEDASSVLSQVHVCVTLVCLGWLLQAFAVHAIVSKRTTPSWLGLATSLADVCWLTAILCFSTGPAGPLAVGYSLIVMLAALRFDLRMVRWTTLAAAIGYIVLLGVTRWPQGIIREIGLTPVPRFHQLMMLLAIAFTGVTAGQIVRLAWRLKALPTEEFSEVTQ